MEGRHASDTLPTYCLLTLLRGLDLTHHTQSRRPGSSSPRCQDPDARIQIPEPPGPKSQKSNTTPQSSPHSHDPQDPPVPSRSPPPDSGLRTQQHMFRTHFPVLPTDQTPLHPTRRHVVGPTQDRRHHRDEYTVSIACGRALSCTQTGQGAVESQGDVRARTGMYLDRSRPGTTGTFRAGLAIELDRESRTPSASGRGSWQGRRDIAIYRAS
jgi:hypothetical protein